MLRNLIGENTVFYALGAVGVLGFLCKCIVNATIKRLVNAAGTMNKSNHKLMKLVKAKFEHACMVSDRVQNVEAFVDKYLYEYRVLGLKLHSWRQMERVTIWSSGIIGVSGALLRYGQYGMDELVFQYISVGIIIMLLLFLLFVGSDEDYQLDAALNYMVDYLENVCARRYERIQEESERAREMMLYAEAEEPKEETSEEEKEEEPEPEIMQSEKQTEDEAEMEAAIRQAEAEESKTEKPPLEEPVKVSASQEILIREILEEFLA